MSVDREVLMYRRFAEFSKLMNVASILGHAKYTTSLPYLLNMARKLSTTQVKEITYAPD